MVNYVAKINGRVVQAFDKKLKMPEKEKKRTKISYPEHKKWKSEVLERDGNKCQICDGIKDLDVYHIYNIDDFPQLALDPDYGITLCPKHRRSLKKR